MNWALEDLIFVLKALVILISSLIFFHLQHSTYKIVKRPGSAVLCFVRKSVHTREATMASTPVRQMSHLNSPICNPFFRWNTLNKFNKCYQLIRTYFYLYMLFNVALSVLELQIFLSLSISNIFYISLFSWMFPVTIILILSKSNTRLHYFAYFERTVFFLLFST